MVATVAGNIGLISASGSVVSSVEIIGSSSSQVIAAPVVGDFNSDGLNDVIITTPHAYVVARVPQVLP